MISLRRLPRATREIPPGRVNGYRLTMYNSWQGGIFAEFDEAIGHGSVAGTGCLKLMELSDS